MKKTQTVIKNLLLVFVFVSIGYAIGKHSVKRIDTKSDDIRDDKGDGRIFFVQVYYMHSTFRCVTCNTIENMTKQLLNSKFKKELNDGLIKFQEVNFQENEKLAKQFDIVASCVVVAKMENGKIVDFKRLDEVWTLLKEPKKFNDYIGNAVMAYLPGKQKHLEGDK